MAERVRAIMEAMVPELEDAVLWSLNCTMLFSLHWNSAVQSEYRHLLMPSLDWIGLFV